ncbi:carbon-nitrogen hydrolase family protein [Aspergillus vadensis CBS 113365]|uniref:nitrilase n=1 Tax=Aspergillus vadensis (strain CBS 113365 / IMI 142717 / IBT 24658) TaxID=1448311 RepID=A0A319AXD5_ASPVC|nr:carbon-nitrogen hydrolase [Aspergillus vadensis CBS 113365]PYH64957.1 carbon-nitrogen hydrolase [Aspergillus vadensis CBS 113365]
MPASNKVRVAVTQHEPVWLDLHATVDKTCRLIAEAAGNGAQLIAFPECWLPGYPAWIWCRPVDMGLFTTYLKNSLSYDSEHMRRICNAAAQHKITVVLGLSERDGNSLYIGQCTIDSTGKIVMRRRKMKPTHMERTVFGESSGRSLLNVVDLPIGKVGALSCWEHIQPLLKYHTMIQGEEIHVSAWPVLHPHMGGESLWGMSQEGGMGASQVYALESASFVLLTTAVLGPSCVEKMNLSPPWDTLGGGASAVIAPDGRRLTEPLPSNEEGFVYADVDLDLILSCRHFVDACGHYSRPDLLWLGVDTREKTQHRPEGQADIATSNPDTYSGPVEEEST